MEENEVIKDDKNRLLLGNPWSLFWIMLVSAILLTGLVNWIQGQI
jgi:hypothetical protein